MGFAASLAAMSDQELEGLLRARTDLLSPRPASFAALASRAASVHSVQLALGRLDRFALQVLHTSCLLGDGATAAMVAGLMRDDRDREPDVAQVRDALKRLRSLALVTGSDDAVDLPGQTRQLLAHPAGLGRPAGVLLATRPRPELDRISTLLAVKVAGNKHQQIDRLARALADPDVIRDLVAGAPAEARELMAELCRRGPVCRLPNDYWYHGGRAARSRSHWLVERALIVPGAYLDAEMPREVGLALRGGVAFRAVEPACPRLAVTTNDPGAVDKDAAFRADAAVRAVAAVLWGWGEAPVPALKSGGLGVRELRKAARTVELGEPSLARLLEVASNAGLLACRAAGTEASYRPTDAFDDWLDATPGERWAVLVEAWLAVPQDLGEVGRAGADGKLPPVLLGGWHGDPGPRRRRRDVVDQLARLAPGARPEPEALAGAVSWAAPAAWGVEAGRASLACAEILDQAALVGATGQGALSTPARLLLEGRRDDAIAAAGVLLPERTTSFTLQADLTCVASGSLDAGVAAELALLAVVESTGAATVYRFSASSLRRAFDAGRSAPDVQAFLAAHATKGVPQALAYLVDDSHRRHGTLRAGAIQCYLRADDPALMEQVVRMRRTAGLGLRLLAPGVAVASVPIARLLDALRTNGFSPVEEDAAGGVVLAGSVQHRATALGAPAGRVRSDPTMDAASVVASLRGGPALPFEEGRGPAPARVLTLVTPDGDGFGRDELDGDWLDGDELDGDELDGDWLDGDGFDGARFDGGNLLG